MSDLIIFKKHPELIPDFVANPKMVPNAFHQKRVAYWEKQFSLVKKEFTNLFSDHLTDKEKSDAEEIYHLRNIIAHAHVSVGRDYMLFRPSGGNEKEKKLIRDLKLQPIEGQADPMILKIELWQKDKLTNASKLIEEFDQVTLKKISGIIGIPHSRIR